MGYGELGIYRGSALEQRYGSGATVGSQHNIRFTVGFQGLERGCSRLGERRVQF